GAPVALEGMVEDGDGSGGAAAGLVTGGEGVPGVADGVPVFGPAGEEDDSGVGDPDAAGGAAGNGEAEAPAVAAHVLPINSVDVLQRLDAVIDPLIAELRPLIEERRRDRSGISHSAHTTKKMTQINVLITDCSLYCIQSAAKVRDTIITNIVGNTVSTYVQDYETLDLVFQHVIDKLRLLVRPMNDLGVANLATDLDYKTHENIHLTNTISSLVKERNNMTIQVQEMLQRQRRVPKTKEERDAEHAHELAMQDRALPIQEALGRDRNEQEARAAVRSAEVTATALTHRHTATLNAVNKNIKLALAGGTASAVLLVTAYLALRKLFEDKPSIIEDGDTSIGTWFKKAKYPEPHLDWLILSPELEQAVRSKFMGMAFAIMNKLPLSNMIFYGPPGVGKTMAAEQFARDLSKRGLADHIIIRGPAFRRLPSVSAAVNALASIIRFARKSYERTGRPVILIFDEAEALFANRLDAALSDAMTRNLVPTMTSLIGAGISDWLVTIQSTNLVTWLDQAIIDRTDKSNRIRFPLPGQKETEVLLKLYLENNLEKKGFTLTEELKENIPHVASQIKGLSGRQIQSMTAQSIYHLLNTDTTELTLPVFKTVVDASQKQEDFSAF
ncbi:MAG: AAA family ATPase, partial [bacterium]